ncbi:jg3524 [Pararge aegeria aegeria]|uniref:Jg3524 protein n=1 Tax=Pararge aegeria aegeria TaxID=348720 RepID=A0A8S4QGG7_9NEOP|nr:jg3524 [Pararge aegeria aegeria]
MKTSRSYGWGSVFSTLCECYIGCGVAGHSYGEGRGPGSAARSSSTPCLRLNSSGRPSQSAAPKMRSDSADTSTYSVFSGAAAVDWKLGPFRLRNHLFCMNTSQSFCV